MTSRKLCEHDPYTTITKVLEPKWSTKEILLSKDTVDRANDILLIRFAKESAFKEFGWFCLEKKYVQRCKLQPNGRGMVYCAKLDKREEFIGIKNCKHLQASLL